MFIELYEASILLRICFISTTEISKYFGSSPEAQLVIKTILQKFILSVRHIQTHRKRRQDAELAKKLGEDSKQQNMSALVDLARNDLNRSLQQK